MVKVASRLLQTILVIFTLITVTFFLLRFLPGGPFDSENSLPPEMKAHLESVYHLDKPFFNQYITYLKSLGVGDLGKSYTYLNQNTLDVIKDSLPVTLELGFMALLFSFLVGIPTGLLAARYHNGLGDKVVMTTITLVMSAPPFLLAPLLILIFSFWFDLLPPALWDGPIYFILPVFTLGIRPATLIARLVRSSAIENSSADFVRTARAIGVPEEKIFFKYILKNSLIPVLGITGPLVAHVLSGSFVVELIFAIPGLGHHFIDSVLDRDYPLVLTLTLFYGIILSVSSLVADIASSFIDPRVKAL